MKNPTAADDRLWRKFEQYAAEHNISLDNEEDWHDWWHAFYSGAVAGRTL